MWKVILKLAVAIGQSEWARKKAAELVDKILRKAGQKAEAIALVGGVK